MKRVIYVTLLAISILNYGHAQEVVLNNVYAQEVASMNASPLLNTKFWNNPEFTQDVVNPPGYRMMKVGRGLTIGGGILLVSGIVLMSTADESYYTSTTTPYGTEEGDPQYAFGVLAVVGGVGMMIPGAIFWSKGSKKFNAYKRSQTSLSLGINNNGVGFRFQF
jgi:hypothetical protein